MKTAIPVNNDILRWARKTIGMTLETISTKMARTQGEIEEWEDGVSAPTYTQLEKLANNYKRPVALFFFPEVPQEDTPATDFRTLPDVQVEDLSPSIIKMYRKAKILQMNIEELYEGINPADSLILNDLHAAPSDEVDSLALRIRNYLGIDISTQKKWTGSKMAFNKWRDILQENGVLVFKDAFRDDGYSGFCIHSKRFPIIYINSTMSDSRQIFTLFHELGHLLLGSSGINYFDARRTDSYSGEYMRIEQFCNAFANEFLVPSSEFDINGIDVSEQDIVRESANYCVSREVILRKFLNAGFITHEKYQSFVDKWIEDYQKSRKNKDTEAGGNPYYSIRSYLGLSYI